jgi:hypothetical protein
VAETCNSSPCLNGGTCSILLDKVQCQCPSGFIGCRCQYSTKEFDLEILINNYENTKSGDSIQELICVIPAQPDEDEINQICDLYRLISKK